MIPYVVVQLRDGNGKPINEHPSNAYAISPLISGGGGKYKVKLMLVDGDGQEVLDLGICDNLVEFNLAGETSKKKTKALPKGFYFNKFSATVSGTYSLVARITNFKEMVYVKTISFDVNLSYSVKLIM